MFFFTYILCVECNVLYSWGPNVQARGAPNHLAPALGTGPPEPRGPMQLHRLKVGPD